MIRFYGNAMQGLMGSYLEKNLQAFQNMQKALQDQSQKIYGDNSRASQELWAQFMNLQGPAMQNLMQAYIEQSQKVFSQFQDQMQGQARSMFAGFPARPGLSGGAAADPAKRATADKKYRCPRHTTIGFVSLGCPKALVDSERILTQLRAEGYAIAPDYAGADLVVVNTCGFIDDAVEESLDAIGEALARERPGDRHRLPRRQAATIVQQAHPEVLAVTGPHALRGGHAARCTRTCRQPHDPFTDLVPPQGIKLTPRHYAYLKISEGCNHRCTLLHHPVDARRPGQPRRSATCCRRPSTWCDAGVKELLVISQDTSAYGVDVKYRTGFWHGRPLKTRMIELCAARWASSASGCGCTTSIPTRTSTRSSR